MTRAMEKPRWASLVFVACLASFGCVDLSRPYPSGVDGRGDMGDGAVATEAGGQSDRPSDGSGTETNPKVDSDASAGDSLPPTPDGPVVDANGSIDVPASGPQPNGQPCSSGSGCSSGICADGVCCNSACTGVCEACNTEIPGTCAPIPAGVDPADECAQDAVATCQRDGACNGARACRLYVTGSVCASATCSSGTESPLRRCDGNGTCATSQPRACAPFACGANACNTTCVTSADCVAGSTCIGGACGTNVGLQLYWNFDEATGTQATDLSGQARHGTYSGNSALPTPSTTVPTLQFANPRSRVFTTAARTQVRLRSVPLTLLAANNMTLSVWFRATSITDPSGYSEMLSLADGYALVMKPNMLSFSKRTGNQSYTGPNLNGTSYLDGQWHHLAGVATTAGMTLYLDGVARATSPSTVSVSYNLPLDFLVGADMDASFGAYFAGNLDEVRVYTRALSAAEVAALAAGGR
jgi:hypothetical protein